MKKIAIILCAVLTLSCIASICVFAMQPKEDIITSADETPDNIVETTLETTNETTDDIIELNATIVDELESLNLQTETTSIIDNNASQYMSYTIAGAPVSLTYETTNIQASGVQTNLYLDEIGNIYTFNQSEQLLDFTSSDDNYLNAIHDYVVDHTKQSTLTEEEAIEYAEKAAKERFGSKFDLVEFDSDFQDDTMSYCIYYFQKLGQDNFIKGIYYYAYVLPDGTVDTSSMGNYDDLINFDESLLDGITEKSIRASVEKVLSEKYGGDVISYELGDARLFNYHGSYYIDLGVTATVNCEDFAKPVTVGEKLRYDLPIAQ